MSGGPAEQDYETTDYRTGTGQKGSLEGHASACPRRAEARPSAALGGASNRIVQSSAGVRLARISRLRKNDRRTYGEVTGVIWLQTSCQPVGIFAKTMLAWNWPLVALPLYCPFSVTRLIATATSPP